MERNHFEGSELHFPYPLDEDVWGEIRYVEQECPGVYYLGTSSSEAFRCGREMYAVVPAEAGSIISEEVLQYGAESGGIYLFEYEVEGSGFELVRYEIGRYCVKNGISLEDRHTSLYTEAIYAAEKYPKYFGGLLPPRHTPYGLTVRTKQVAEGTYFLETDRCQWILAVAFPVWSCDLSEEVQKLGKNSEADLLSGVEEARYLFFDEEHCAPAIYELRQIADYQGLDCYISSRAVLETQLYLHYLDYVVWHNAMESTGHGMSDMLSNILALFGVEPPEREETEEQKTRRLENCIHLTLDATGQRLLTLPE